MTFLFGAMLAFVAISNTYSQSLSWGHYFVYGKGSGGHANSPEMTGYGIDFQASFSLWGFLRFGNRIDLRFLGQLSTADETNPNLSGIGYCYLCPYVQIDFTSFSIVYERKHDGEYFFLKEDELGDKVSLQALAGYKYEILIPGNNGPWGIFWERLEYHKQKTDFLGTTALAEPEVFNLYGISWRNFF